jgi:hypothetical protein
MVIAPVFLSSRAFRASERAVRPALFSPSTDSAISAQPVYGHWRVRGPSWLDRRVLRVRTQQTLPAARPWRGRRAWIPLFVCFGRLTIWGHLDGLSEISNSDYPHGRAGRTSGYIRTVKSASVDKSSRLGRETG